MDNMQNPVPNEGIGTDLVEALNATRPSSREAPIMGNTIQTRIANMNRPLNGEVPVNGGEGNNALFGQYQSNPATAIPHQEQHHHHHQQQQQQQQQQLQDSHPQPIPHHIPYPDQYPPIRNAYNHDPNLPPSFNSFYECHQRADGTVDQMPGMRGEIPVPNLIPPWMQEKGGKNMDSSGKTFFIILVTFIS